MKIWRLFYTLWQGRQENKRRKKSSLLKCIQKSNVVKKNWVLVFSFMYLVLVDAIHLSLMNLFINQNEFGLFIFLKTSDNENQNSGEQKKLCFRELVIWYNELCDQIIFMDYEIVLLANFWSPLVTQFNNHQIKFSVFAI